MATSCLQSGQPFFRFVEHLLMQRLTVRVHRHDGQEVFDLDRQECLSSMERGMNVK